jgi:hypothetical protein
LAIESQAGKSAIRIKIGFAEHRLELICRQGGLLWNRNPWRFGSFPILRRWAAGIYLHERCEVVLVEAKEEVSFTSPCPVNARKQMWASVEVE